MDHSGLPTPAPLRARALQRLQGHHPAIEDVRKSIEKLAPTALPVLLVGEPGTGKERTARALHEQSPRASGPFVKLDCTSLTEERLAARVLCSEAPPETFRPRADTGRLGRARGGTLYLAEITRLPRPVQAQLLARLSQLPHDPLHTTGREVRVVASSCHDPGQHGSLLPELYALLAAQRITLPPLRTRRSDIPALAAAYTAERAAELGRPAEVLAQDALEVLLAHDWPGNLRELEHVLDQAVAHATEPAIRAEHLRHVAHGATGDLRHMIPGSTLADIERVAILRTLEFVGGSTSRAAAILGISPRKIQYRLRDYGLRRLGSRGRLVEATGTTPP